MFRTKLLILFVCFTMWEGCSSMDITGSKWADVTVPIDGTSDKWNGKTFYVPDKSIMVGLQNDSSYLYLVMTTRDRNNQMQILGRGFTVWFDKDGGKDKTFGIKYPAGILGTGFMRPGMNEDTTDRIIQMFDRATMNKEIEILGPGENDVQRADLGDAKGIEIKLTRSSDVLIYEMKVALRNSPDNIYAIGVSKSNPGIGVGFETTEMDFSKMKPKREDNGKRDPGEMEPGNRGPGNRGPGNFPKGMQQQMPEQLNYWMKVDLATKGKVK